MQFGNVAEIAMILNAEFVAFCSRQDDYASFTVAQQQHRAKMRKVLFVVVDLDLFFVQLGLTLKRL